MLETIEGYLTSESKIYIGSFPSNAIDNICTITLMPGRPSQHVMGQQWPIIRNPSIKIIIRDSSYAHGAARCEAIIGLIDGKSDVTNNIGLIQLESDVVALGQDERNRSEFYMIFRCIIL